MPLLIPPPPAGHPSRRRFDRWARVAVPVVAAAAAVAPGGGPVLTAGTAQAQTVSAASVTLNQVWSVKLNDFGHPIALSSPGLATLDGRGPSVVVGDRTGHVYAFHLGDGSAVAGWPVATGAPVDSTPSSLGSSVFVGAGNAATPNSGGYFSFAGNGARRWVRTIGALPGGSPLSGVQASLAVGSLQGVSSVVAGGLGQMEDALNAANGAVLPGFPWFQADSNFSTPALADLYSNGRTEIVEGGASTAGNAYNVQYQNGGHVRVLSQTGTLLCQYNTDQEVDSSPAVGRFLSGGAVGITVGTGAYWPGPATTNRLLGLDTHCNLKWITGLDGRTTDSPALADFLGNGQLQVAEGTDINNQHQSGSVWLVNAATGQPIWHVPVAGAVLGGPVSADLGRGYQDVIVGTTGGLQILDGRTGQTVATALHGVMAMQNVALVTNDPNGTIGITAAGYNGYNQGMVVHFEVAGSSGRLVNEGSAWPMFHRDPHLSGNAGTPAPVVAIPCPPATGSGYRLTASDGGVFVFGSVPYCGSTGSLALYQPVVGIAPTRDGSGYWLATADGRVFAFGNARNYGSLEGVALNKPIVAIAATPDGGGYWMVATDGGVFAFGDAHFYGSMGSVRLNQPVVGMTADPVTGGYWLVARDGGIFAFHAPFYGSMGSVRLNRPVVGMASDRRTGGYRLVASDGGIFAFHAPFYGSMGSVRLNRPVVGMASDPSTGGYWMVASDGGIFTFDAPFFGSTGSVHLNRPMVGMAGS